MRPLQRNISYGILLIVVYVIFVTPNLLFAAPQTTPVPVPTDSKFTRLPPIPQTPAPMETAHPVASAVTTTPASSPTAIPTPSKTPEEIVICQASFCERSDLGCVNGRCRLALDESGTLQHTGEGGISLGDAVDGCAGEFKEGVFSVAGASSAAGANTEFSSVFDPKADSWAAQLLSKWETVFLSTESESTITLYCHKLGNVNKYFRIKFDNAARGEVDLPLSSLSAHWTASTVIDYAFNWDSHHGSGFSRCALDVAYHKSDGDECARQSIDFSCDPDFFQAGTSFTASIPASMLPVSTRIMLSGVATLKGRTDGTDVVGACGVHALIQDQRFPCDTWLFIGTTDRFDPLGLGGSGSFGDFTLAGGITITREQIEDAIRQTLSPRNFEECLIGN